MLLRRIRWWFGGSIRHFFELAGDSAGEARRENLFSAGEAVRREREELNKFNGFAASSRLVRPFLTFY